jgi:hypothetical protein
LTQSHEEQQAKAQAAHDAQSAEHRREIAGLEAGLGTTRSKLASTEAELGRTATTLRERERDVARLEGDVAERDRRAAEHKALIADLEKENAGFQEQLLKAYQKIKSDEAIANKAKKAMAIALTLLDGEKEAAGLRPPASDGAPQAQGG